MKKYVVFALVTIQCSAANASITDVFRDELGRTKWQYVANFSASVLILLLSIAVVALIVSLLKFRKVNHALRDIKRGLEEIVVKRTEKLHESNRLLTDSNERLKREVDEHYKTSVLLRESQNYIQNILESMPSILIGLNDKHEVTQWNRMAEEISGVPAQSALGGNLWTIYPAITVTPEQIARVEHSGKPEVIKHSQRGQYYFDISIFPLRGGMSGTVLVIENVTQRTLTENMLIQRDKLSLMGELAATMASDINVPLQTILSDVNSVKVQVDGGNPDTDTLLRVLDDASDKGRQASAVIMNLIDFSQRRGQEKEKVLPAELMDNCLSLAFEVISELDGLKMREVNIERQYQEGLAPFSCYVPEMQQVLLSIFRHSLRAMSKRNSKDFQPQVTVRVYEELDYLWITVKHNGMGLSEREQVDIFEPFFSSVSSLQPKEIDMRDRLSFSHFIVTEQHRGQMAVTSDESGSTVYLQFQSGSA